MTLSFHPNRVSGKYIYSHHKSIASRFADHAEFNTQSCVENIDNSEEVIFIPDYAAKKTANLLPWFHSGYRFGDGVTSNELLVFETAIRDVMKLAAISNLADIPPDEHPYTGEVYLDAGFFRSIHPECGCLAGAIAAFSYLCKIMPSTKPNPTKVSIFKHKVEGSGAAFVFNPCDYSSGMNALSKNRRKAVLHIAQGHIHKAIKKKLKMGFIYAIGSLDEGYIKIGSSRTDVEQRMNQLQTGCPFKCEILSVIPTLMLTERYLHVRFNEFKSHGEWFRADDRILDFFGI